MNVKEFNELAKEFNELAKEFNELAKEEILDNVFPYIVNKKFTGDKYDDAISYPVDDLLCLYGIRRKLSDEESAFLIIRESFINEHGIGIHEIREAAIKNTEGNYTVEKLFSDTMFVVNNTKSRYGAAVLSDINELIKISQELNGSFYIIPSSIYEIIAIPDMKSEFNLDPLHLSDMIKEVNSTELQSGEELSDHAYYFDADEEVLKSL